MLCFRRIICLGPWQCRLKYLFEFAKGLGARESWLGDPSLAAGRDVQHPERHFQNPRCLELLQAAVRHRSAPFYESGMHPYCPPMPWMPGIPDFTDIPNMGVVLLSCTSTFDAAHLFVVEAKKERAVGLPKPTLATMFEVVAAGKIYHVTGAALQRWIVEKRSSWKGPKGYLFCQRPGLE